MCEAKGRRLQLLPPSLTDIIYLKGPQLKLTAFAKMNCSRCKKQITGDNYVVTLDQQWHTECAACDSCSAPLTADGYYQVNDKVVCPKCYDKKGHGHGPTSGDKNGNKHDHGHGHGHGHVSRVPIRSSEYYYNTCT
jgi:uncharacterized CHY-type Zn-finger protein